MFKKKNKNNLFKKITYNKKISIFFVSLVLLIGIIITTGILLFSDKDEDLSRPKSIAYIYDGEKHDAPPAKENYEIDVVHCDKAVGEWDNVKWNLTLKEIEGKTTCILNYKRRVLIHTLTIDPNGGTYEGTTGTSQIDMKEEQIYELTDPTRKGYTFAGWEADNDSAEIRNDIFVMGRQNTKITAKWEINTYQVEIRESNTCDGTKSGNYNQRIALCAPENEGYTFIGWETTSGTIEGNALVLDDSNATVTATWTANDYDYIVVHKQEALSGAYTIVDTETHNAAFGTTVRPNTKSYTGFTSPEKSSLTIGANSEDNKVQYLYTRNKYTLTINPGAGTTTTLLEQELKFEESITIENPTRRGYNFTGWTKTSGTLQDNVFTMGASDATLTANYEAISSTLYFDANGGQASSASKTVTYDSQYGTLPTATREGYVFDGWYVNGNKIESTTIVDIVNVTSAVAHWTKGSYILSINPNGGRYDGSTAISQQGMEFEDEIAIEDPVREGYTFDGWTVSGTGATYDANSNVFKIGASNATLTANWTINSYEYTVNHKLEGLNGNYETANTDTDNATYNSTVSPNTREYTGFTSPERQTITIGVENNVINYLYTRNSYTLTINPGAGTTTPLTQTLKYQQTTEVANPTRRGYNFTGWSKVGNSTLSGTTLTMGSENTTLTANYEAKTFTITFNANEGSVSPTSKTVTFAQSYGDLPTPVREGYDFNGWYLNGTKIESTTTVNIEDNATLVANWTRGTNTLSIIPNGGKYNNTTDVTTMTLQYQDEANIQDATREGYTFTGWTVSGTGSTFNSSTKVFKMGSTNASLTAKWNINKYNLTIEDTYTCDGVQNLDYNSTYPLCTPTREGYTFDGWEDTDNVIGNNNIVTMKAKDSTVKAKWRVNSYSYAIYHNKMNLDGETYTEVEDDRVTGTKEYGTVLVTEPKTYTGFTSPEAQTITVGVSNNTVNYNYTRNKYTLTINPNGGTYTGTTPLELYYEEQTTIPNPSKTGHTFTEWTIGGNSSLNVRTLTMGSENTTLTANYNARTYTVYFNPKGGSVTPESITVTYGQQYGELPTPVRTDYDFEGWYTAQTGGTKIVATDTVNITSTQNLYAHWDADYAIFNSGSTVNQMMKQLAGNTTVSSRSSDTYITGIERSSTLSSTENIVSQTGYTYDGKPIYMWFDNSKIKWYSDASKVYLSANSDYMFNGLGGVTSLNLSQFNTSKVTSMYRFFAGMSGLTSLDLSPLDTSNVTDMARMFDGTTGLTNINLSPLNTSQVSNMAYMFTGSGLRNINFGTFDTSSVTSMQGMFSGMTNITSLTLPAFNLSNIIDMSKMFAGISSLTSLDVTNLNPSNAQEMNAMFFGLTNLRTINLNNFTATNATDMNGMFKKSGFTRLDLSSMNISKVSSMHSMFMDMPNLTSVTFGNIDTSNVTNMGNLFYGDSSLNNVDVNNLDTENVTAMPSMFRETGFVNLDLSSFNTQNLTYVSDCSYGCYSSYSDDGHEGGGGGGCGGNVCGMFRQMPNLVTLDISSFDTSRVEMMDYLFASCPNLTTIYASDKWSTSSATSSMGMFDDDTSLRGGAGTTYSASYVDKTRARIDAGSSGRGYFTYKAAP